MRDQREDGERRFHWMSDVWEEELEDSFNLANLENVFFLLKLIHQPILPLIPYTSLHFYKLFAFDLFLKKLCNPFKIWSFYKIVFYKQENLVHAYSSHLPFECFYLLACHHIDPLFLFVCCFPFLSKPLYILLVPTCMPLPISLQASNACSDNNLHFKCSFDLYPLFLYLKLYKWIIIFTRHIHLTH